MVPLIPDRRNDKYDGQERDQFISKGGKQQQIKFSRGATSIFTDSERAAQRDRVQGCDDPIREWDP